MAYTHHISYFFSVSCRTLERCRVKPFLAPPYKYLIIRLFSALVLARGTFRTAYFDLCGMTCIPFFAYTNINI